ncbi:hypothetical protein AB0K35_28720 [Micromonospora sp. NPDC053740]|uniref:hypothetical protein n=1 Tax=Micromonospora TaxID=1873 RepID=UPI001EE7F631|nr:hypothetical protein [Micromonospora alfalfae]MCG5464097.1 hypothetical protein [Micromonospora alfalfae]
MRISPYQWPEDGDEHDVLVGIAPKRVTLLLEGRNAWHSKWIRSYQGSAAMFLNQASARDAAEERRKQGSVFYVFDTPALLLFGVYTNCVVTDFHQDDPFNGFVGFRQPTYDPWLGWRGILPGVKMHTAVASIGPERSMWEERSLSQHSFIRGSVSDGREIADLEDGLVSVSSFSQGRAYRLGWRDREQRYSTKSVSRATDVWFEHMHAIPEVRRLMRSVWETSDHGARDQPKSSVEESRQLLATALLNHASNTWRPD